MNSFNLQILHHRILSIVCPPSVFSLVRLDLHFILLSPLLIANGQWIHFLCKRLTNQCFNRNSETRQGDLIRIPSKSGE